MTFRYGGLLKLILVLLLGQVFLSAGTVGNWSASTRSWNHPDMATLKALLIANGHVVEADEAITAANLSNNTLFVVGEPGSAPTAGEMTDLVNWVNGGGILILMTNSTAVGVATLNAISAALGASLVWGGGPVNAAILGGVFASTGPPFNIVGQTLAVTPGTAVSGGNALAGTYVRWQQIGSGFVFGFADRLDHNVFAPSAANVNGQLFLNLAFAAGTVTPGGGCPPHRIHGHLPGPVDHPAGHAVGSHATHEHHGQHGHTVAVGCPPHAPGHSPGLLPEREEGLFAPEGVEAAIVGALNEDGTINGNSPAAVSVGGGRFFARRGMVLQLFGTAKGLTADAVIEVRFGQALAKVLYSGPAPGLKDAWQINALIPDDAPVGPDVHVTVLADGKQLRSVDVAIE